MLRQIMYRILFLAFVYTCLIIYVARADFAELQEVSIDYKNFRMINPGSRNPLTYPEAPKEGLDFYIKSDFFWNWVFIEAKVESFTTLTQFREVGLERRIGLHLGKFIDVSLYHLSEHRLDGVFPQDSFPEEDGVAFKVYLFRR